jgi:pyruvate/2-oxoglutarate dehydrogenase complex dihydrolipoamide dehydrogenase (E3) component
MQSTTPTCRSAGAHVRGQESDELINSLGLATKLELPSGNPPARTT